MGDEGFLEQVVDRWRMSGIGSGGDMPSQVAMMADAVGLTNNSISDAVADADAGIVAPTRHSPASEIPT